MEKTTATGQGTPALTPLTIVAREVTNQRIEREKEESDRCPKLKTLFS